ncbi:MAG: 50S ribosomal protein L10 [Candidatus Diapherotrites archaeon]|nr:50S ribosomal protein L10 [Candidatus Diapherotrites archaeon]
MAHVAEWKKKAVAGLEELIKAHPVIAISSIESLPASQFQEIREKLRDQAVVKVAKLKLLKLAFENSGVKGLGQLEGHMEGPTAVIFSDVNPFKLYNFLKKNKSMAPARAGQAAPYDIVVPKGDTGLPPGPALGELKVAGINARIDGGSIKVMKDSTVAKEGDTITEEQAAALSKLGLKPMEVGMTLEAALENGMIFTSEILDISEEETLSNIQKAYMSGFNLAFNAGYFMKENIETFLQKASTEARNLGVEASILDKGIVEDLLAKGEMQAKAISSLVKEA